jgi:hypothetical protein
MHPAGAPEISISSKQGHHGLQVGLDGFWLYQETTPVCWIAHLAKPRARDENT